MQRDDADVYTCLARSSFNQTHRSIGLDYNLNYENIYADENDLEPMQIRPKIIEIYRAGEMSPGKYFTLRCVSSKSKEIFLLRGLTG